MPCVVPWSPVNSLIKGLQYHLPVKEHQLLFTWLHLIGTVDVHRRENRGLMVAFRIKDCGVSVPAAKPRFHVTSVKEERRVEIISISCVFPAAPHPYVLQFQPTGFANDSPSLFLCVVLPGHFPPEQTTSVTFSLQKKSGGAMTQLPPLPDHLTATATKWWL